MVDLVTMATLMPVRDLHLVIERQCEREIQASDIKPKWCPNHACGRLIKINREGAEHNFIVWFLYTLNTNKKYAYTVH